MIGLFVFIHKAECSRTESYSEILSSGEFCEISEILQLKQNTSVHVQSNTK